MPLEPTPSQTVGPFLRIGLLDGPLGPDLVAADDPRALVLHGRVSDGAGAPVADALLELWQANAAGRYAHPADERDEVPLEPGFSGFGRCGSDPEGRFRFVTVKPGRVPDADGRLQAPHIAVAVFARGLLKRLATRVYFPDEAAANDEDLLLAALEPDERATLVAVPDGAGLRFDVRLQGPGETVFLAS